MAVSPADFELYSRATGTPLPRTPQEQMQMAPQVYQFIQNRGYQQEGFFDSALGRGLRNAAIIGGAYALGNALKGRKTDPPTPPSGGSGAVSVPVSPVTPLPPTLDPNSGGFDPSGGMSPSGVRPSGGNPPVSPQTIEATWEDQGREMPVVQELVTPTGNIEIHRYDPDGVLTTQPKTPVSRENVGTTGSLIRDLNSQIDRSDVWDSGEQSIATSQGFNRPGPAPRDVIEEVGSGPNYSRQVAAPTPANVVMAGGRSVVANPRVVGWDQEGEPILKQPKAAFTNKDLQFPFPNRTNPGMAFIAASTEAPTTGIPGIDEVSVPVLTQLTGMHIPGIGQAVTTAGPYIAGLGRQAAGDIVDTARFAGSGLTYVAENLRPILNQGRADIGKGIRDLRQGYEDIGILGSKIGAAHDKYLVQPTQRLAGNIQLSLPTSSFQESDPVETGGESILNDHPDVAQEGTGSDEVQNNKNYNVQGNVDLDGEPTSEGGNFLTKFVNNTKAAAKAAWDENTEIANEIAREQSIESAAQDVIDEIRASDDVIANPANFEQSQYFEPKAPKQVQWVSKTGEKGGFYDAGSGTGVESIGYRPDGYLEIDWHSKNKDKRTEGGYVFDDYVGALKKDNRDALVRDTADPRFIRDEMSPAEREEYIKLGFREMRADADVYDALRDKKFGYGEDQVSPGKFAQRAKTGQGALLDFIDKNRDILRGE